MKPIWSVIIFLFLLSSSVLSSIHSYRCAREDIEADLNRALTLTLRHKKDLYITPDTIRTYRSYITLDRVRNSAFLTYSRPDEKPVGLFSRSMICRVGNESLSLPPPAPTVPWLPSFSCPTSVRRCCSCCSV